MCNVLIRICELKKVINRRVHKVHEKNGVVIEIDKGSSARLDMQLMGIRNPFTKRKRIFVHELPTV